MPTESAVLRIVGTTRNAVNYWRARGLLTVPLAKTTPGVAREYSRENALEVAFMATLTACGVAPAHAAPITQSFMASERKGQLSRFFLTRAGASTAIGGSKGLAAQSYVEVFRSQEPKPDQGALVTTATYAVIDAAMIVKRIDAVFAEPSAALPSTKRRRRPNVADGAE